MAEAYIVEAVRTAGGRRNGRLAGWHPADMAAETLNAVVERSGMDPVAVEDVILGCVTQAGEQAFAFGRNASPAPRGFRRLFRLSPSTASVAAHSRRSNSPRRRLCPAHRTL